MRPNQRVLSEIDVALDQNRGDEWLIESQWEVLRRGVRRGEKEERKEERNDVNWVLELRI